MQAVRAPPATPVEIDLDVPMTEIIEKNPLEMKKDSANGFKCPHCKKTYEDGRALGGHASKSHVGMSKAYNHKMEVRKKREGHRAALSLAKMLLNMYSESSDV